MFLEVTQKTQSMEEKINVMLEFVPIFLLI